MGGGKDRLCDPQIANKHVWDGFGCTLLGYDAQNVVTSRRVRRCFIIESVAVAAFVRPFCRSILWAVVRRVQSPVQRRIVRRTINVFAARACISAFATFTVATFNVATLFVTGRFSVCAEPNHDGEVPTRQNDATSSPRHSRMQST